MLVGLSSPLQRRATQVFDVDADCVVRSLCSGLVTGSDSIALVRVPAWRATAFGKKGSISRWCRVS